MIQGYGLARDQPKDFRGWLSSCLLAGRMLRSCSKIRVVKWAFVVSLKLPCLQLTAESDRHKPEHMKERLGDMQHAILTQPGLLSSKALM